MKKLVLMLVMVALLTVAVFSAAMAAVNPANCSHSSCKWVTKTAATCSAGGIEWWTCNTCGKSLYYRSTAKNPSNHPSGKLQWKPDMKATCCSTGRDIRVCNACGKTVATRSTSVDPNNHPSGKLEWKPDTKATCCSTGTDKRVCNGCGKTVATRTTSKDPNNHPSGKLEWKPDTKATCCSTGTDKRVCNGCGKTVGTRTTDKDPNNHPSSKLSDWKPVTTATCMSGGTEKRVCNACNKDAATRTTDKDPNNHVKWGDPWTTTKKACSHREGSESRFCACGAYVTQKIDQEPASWYKPDFKKISDQTCESDEVWEAKCPVCGHLDYETRAYATGHHMCNSNNNTLPYPVVCEDKYYEEWCDNPGCPLNKHRTVYIPGTRHYPTQEYRDGKYVTVCSECGTILPDDYSRY